MTINQEIAADTMRERAVALAQNGYRIFRLEPFQKVPTDKNFPSIATDDPAKVSDLWTDATGRPTNHNIGILTGSGLVAVDYDTKGGKAGLAQRDLYDAQGMPQSARVRTPTGGEHLFLKTDPKIVFGSSVEKLAPGVDTRGRNSYVVGPGSVVYDENDVPQSYDWIIDKPKRELDPAPDWFVRQLLLHSSYRDTPESTMPLIDEDLPHNVERATQWLLNDAGYAVEGHGGDESTYKVAAKLRELGISESFALDLMLEHWNDTKATPPWSADDLEIKVRNAYRYAQSRPGAGSALADFEAVEIADNLVRPVTPENWPKATQVNPFDPASIPPRVYVFENTFAYNTVSALVAPSGAGKTQWLIQAALSLASGNPTPVALTPTKKQKVWLWNQEDDMDELRRRLAASMIAFDIGWDQIKNRLYFDSGVGHALKLAGKDQFGRLRANKAVNDIISQIKENNINVFMADPLVEFHTGAENDNVEMAFVASLLRRIATEGNCAVIIGHHDRKPDTASSSGHVGNQHAMRGASAMQGVTRAIATLYTMSEKDADDCGVPKEERHRYLRLDGAKNNLGRISGKATWFERYGQCLDFDGEEIGVLKPKVFVESETEDADFNAEPLAVVAAALKILEQEKKIEPNSAGWYAWTDVLVVLSDKSRWEPQWYRGAKTWKNWIAACESGLHVVGEMQLHVAKRRGKRGVQMRAEKLISQDFML